MGKFRSLGCDDKATTVTYKFGLVSRSFDDIYPFEGLKFDLGLESRDRDGTDTTIEEKGELVTNS